jgi:type IV pilus assembly protein PilQ
MRAKLSIVTTFICVWMCASVSAHADSSRSDTVNQVRSVQVTERADGTYIWLEGTQVPTFSVFKLTDPLRLFIDVSNSEIVDTPEDRNVGNGVVSRVALFGLNEEGEQSTRLIVGFDQAAHYDVRADGNKIVVYVDGAKRHERRDLASTRPDPSDAEAQREAIEAQKALGRQLATRTAQLEQLQSEVKDRRAKLERTEIELGALHGELEATTGQMRDALGVAAREKSQEVDRLSKRIQQQDGLVTTLRDEITRSELTRVAAMKKVDAQAAESLRSDREIATLEGSLTLMKRELQEVRADNQNFRAIIEEQVKVLRHSNQESQELVAKIADARTDANSKKDGAIRQLESDRQRLEAALRLQAGQLADARGDADALAAREQELETLVSRRDRDLAAALQAVDRAKKSDGVAGIATPANQIQGIKLEEFAGKSRIVIDMDRPGQFETLPWQDSRAVMLLNNVELPENLTKQLQKGAESGAVRLVSARNTAHSVVRVEAELGNASRDVVHHRGGQLIWEFAPALPRTVATRNELRQVRPEAVTHTAAPPARSVLVTDPTRVRTVPGMKRKRISIDLREADIQNVLRLIAKEGGVNIVSGDGISGSVTIRLRSVPLDEVFLTVLQTLQLGYEKRGNVIRVAAQETLLKEQVERAAASQMLQQSRPLEVFLLPVNYADAVDLTNQVASLLTSRGSVSVDDRTNTLIIKDISDNLAAVRALVESLDTQVPQIMIEARIVETNDTFDQQFGIQWGGDFSMSQANGNPTGLLFPNVLGLGGGATDGQAPTAGVSPAPNYAVNLPVAAGTGSGGALGLSLGSVGGAVNLSLRLSALEQAGHAKLVTSPKILTLDNNTAKISQGTSIPVSVVSAAGVQTAFVQAVLELEVTPSVTPDGHVRMEIKATKNEPDFTNTGARGDPSIIKKEAETVLLVKDGDTTVIGGIYSSNTGTGTSSVPFFSRIPVLGTFFKSSSTTDKRSELLIFLTPKIVNRQQSVGLNRGSGNQ